MASDPPVDPPPLDSPSPPPLPPSPPPPHPLPPDLSALLSRLPPPHAPPLGTITPRAPPRQTREQTDERCWVFTNQSNARRALGLEPQISMYCYINFRNALSSLTPVPGHPNAFLAKDAPPIPLPDTLSNQDQSTGGGEELAEGPGQVKKVTLKSTRVGDRDVNLPGYWWRWLDGRYWYVAKGKTAVERHFKEMGDLSKLERDEQDDQVNSWRMIRRIETRCREKKEADLLPGKREERQMKKALGVVDLNENSESLTSLSSLYSTTLQRLHAHVLRIYSPLLTSLSLLPKTYTDGTQTELLSTIFTRLTDGSAFVLGERMVGALSRVSGELVERKERRDQERRNRREGGDGGIGGGPVPPVDVGFGGQQPRVPPSRFNEGPVISGRPFTPRPRPPPNEGEEEKPSPAPTQEGESSSKPEEKKSGPTWSFGKPPPPGTPVVSIGCSIM